MKNLFRIDILFALLTPLFCGVCYMYFSSHTLDNVALLFLFIAIVIFEIPFLYEPSNINSRDQGIISGLLSSTVLTVSWLFSTPMNKVNYLYIFTLVFLGISLRVISKIYLGKNFSHSVRIRDNHNLITNGVYSLVRHPAYTGTFLIMIGATLGLNLIFKLFLLICTFIFAEIRVRKEEKLMIQYFNKSYIDYKNKTKKYILYIY